MLISLIQLECKMWLKNVIFYVYLAILFLFYATQMGSTEGIVAPEVNMEGGYGTILTTDTEQIMTETVNQLYREYERGYFVTYPTMFYKEVRLTESQMEEMDAIFSVLTDTENEWPVTISASLTYEEFQKQMLLVEELIGAGSEYSQASYTSIRVSQTYEEAVEEYELFLAEDNVVSAYARLFCDYIGIVLGILPVFLAAERVLRDRHAKISDVIYSKKISAKTLILSRFLSMTIMMFIPVVILSCIPLATAVYNAEVLGTNPDYFAFAKYCFGWLLPTLMTVTALSYFLSTLKEGILGILCSTILWFLSLSGGLKFHLRGAGWNLMPRFNVLGGYSDYQAMLSQLIQNRILYFLMSIVLVIGTVFVVRARRKGGIKFGGKKTSHRKSEPQA